MEINKNCGIYKITSPTGRIYIGQSVNIKLRFRAYKNGGGKGQPKLRRSIDKYGWNEHQFDIIEYCDLEDLNCSERFWQDEFDVLNEGLNCVLQQCGAKRRTLTETSIKALKERMKGEGNPNWGIPFSPDRSKAQSERMSGENHHFYNVKGENHPLFGRKGAKRTDMEGAKNPKAKKVKDTVTGKIYDTITEAALDINISRKRLSGYLTGRRKNKTNLIYLDQWNA